MFTLLDINPLSNSDVLLTLVLIIMPIYHWL